MEINKIDKPKAKLPKKKETTQINKIRDKGILQQIPLKFRGSLGNILKNYTSINKKA
jgi:hypothetical protein